MFGQARRPEYRSEMMDMTAMVDVMFQLMTFLILTYQVSAEPAVTMPKTRTGANIDETEAIMLTVAPPEAEGGPARVYDSLELDPRRRLDDPESIKAAVEHGLAEGRRKVIVQADGDVTYGEFLRVAGIAGQVQGVSVHVGVEEDKGD